MGRKLTPNESLNRHNRPRHPERDKVKSAHVAALSYAMGWLRERIGQDGRQSLVPHASRRIAMDWTNLVGEARCDYGFPHITHDWVWRMPAPPLPVAFIGLDYAGQSWEYAQCVLGLYQSLESAISEYAHDKFEPWVADAVRALVGPMVAQQCFFWRKFRCPKNR